MMKTISFQFKINFMNLTLGSLFIIFAVYTIKNIFFSKLVWVILPPLMGKIGISKHIISLWEKSPQQAGLIILRLTGE